MSIQVLRELIGPDVIPTRSIVIFATHRSGSTLLESSLERTGVAGYTREYFTARGITLFTEQWHVAPQDFFVYLRAVFKHGTSPNGIFSVKVMYRDLIDVFERIREHKRFRVMSDNELLNGLFPNATYIYLKRRDKVRQAISLLRANQTGSFHLWRGEQGADTKEAVFDLEQLDRHLDVDILQSELGWKRLFEENNLRPYHIIYEDFVTDYRGTLLRLFDHLMIPEFEPSLIDAPALQKIADELNEQWYERYFQAGGWLADPLAMELVQKEDYTKLYELRPRPMPSSAKPAQDPHDTLARLFENSKERLSSLFNQARERGTPRWDLQL